MNGGVLISTRPKWCEEMASGKKTIEVRKTKPNLQTPFKVYIYETYDKKYADTGICFSAGHTFEHACKKVIGEFICDRIDEYGAEFTDLQYPDACDKHVCLNTIKRVEYDEEEDGPVYRYVTSNEEENPDDCKFLKESCLTFNEVRKYIGETYFDEHFYGWHISQLKIYDKPKELRQFRTITNCGSIIAKDMLCNTCCICSDFCTKKPKRITRPPQSWCYVEELKSVSR